VRIEIWVTIISWSIIILLLISRQVKLLLHSKKEDKEHEQDIKNWRKMWK